VSNGPHCAQLNERAQEDLHFQPVITGLSHRSTVRVFFSVEKVQKAVFIVIFLVYLGDLRALFEHVLAAREQHETLSLTHLQLGTQYREYFTNCESFRHQESR